MHTSTSLVLGPNDALTPRVVTYPAGERTHPAGEIRPPFTAVRITDDLTIQSDNPAHFAALAAAALSAAQQLEAAIEEHAARQVNEVNAETDSQPFGTPIAAAS